ncbi:MAG: hypothetical protein ACI9CE_004035 [Flavobacterium sp.]|jgi:hypothetical protein
MEIVGKAPWVLTPFIASGPTLMHDDLKLIDEFNRQAKLENNPEATDI